jgi:hypothetical protein
MSIISSRDNNTFVEFSDDDIMTPFDGRHFLDGTERFWVVPTLSGWYRHFLGGDTLVASLDYALAI